MHKHITSVIASVIRQRLRALVVLGFLLAVVGCVAEADSEPAADDEPVASELVSEPVDDLVLDEVFDVEAYQDEAGVEADAAGRCGYFPACRPGFHCCNGFCRQITPGYRCRDRSGRDTI